MGYFSNGTEGLMYEEKYCERCVHYEDADGNHACPVWAAHLFYCYGADEKTQRILDMLIPQEGVGNGQCTMFVEDPAKKDIDRSKHWVVRNEDGQEIAILPADLSAIDQLIQEHSEAMQKDSGT